MRSNFIVPPFLLPTDTISRVAPKNECTNMASDWQPRSPIAPVPPGASAPFYGSGQQSAVRSQKQAVSVQLSAISLLRSISRSPNRHLPICQLLAARCHLFFSCCLLPAAHWSSAFCPLPAANCQLVFNVFTSSPLTAPPSRLPFHPSRPPPHALCASRLGLARTPRYFGHRTRRGRLTLTHRASSGEISQEFRRKESSDSGRKPTTDSRIHC